ncbi:hypothetical protein Tco_0000224 [Tanacetum coccineum]
MDPSITQKEETYQVVLDIIMNTPCYNAFLIPADIDVELFKEIIDICPRVQNHEFTVPSSSDSLLEFLLDLGYKGDIYQVYGKPILDTLITNEIKITEAYKTFFGISTGLIPSKKGIEPPSVPAKKTQESSGKLKGIELLSDAAQLELETHRAIKARRRESRFQHQTGGSSKGAGMRLEVPNEPSDKSADSDEGAGTSPEVSDKSEDKKEEDDASIDIEKIDDERINTDVEDQVKDVVEMNVAEEADEENTKRVEEQKEDEELKAEEEQKEMIKLEMNNYHFVSSNFGNQFINSPNASLIGTIPENDEAEINSLSDVQIQQDVPNVQQEPFHAVKVSVIPKTTQQPPFTPPTPPPPATEIPSTQFSNSEAVKSIV